MTPKSGLLGGIGTFFADDAIIRDDRSHKSNRDLSEVYMFALCTCIKNAFNHACGWLFCLGSGDSTALGVRDVPMREVLLVPSQSLMSLTTICVACGQYVRKRLRALSRTYMPLHLFLSASWRYSGLMPRAFAHKNMVLRVERI